MVARVCAALQVSMKKLIISGRLRLTLTPLLKDMPFVGTIQASVHARRQGSILHLILCKNGEFCQGMDERLDSCRDKLHALGVFGKQTGRPCCGNANGRSTSVVMVVQLLLCGMPDLRCCLIR